VVFGQVNLGYLHYRHSLCNNFITPGWRIPVS